jgi:hypothetical protein
MTVVELAEGYGSGPAAYEAIRRAAAALAARGEIAFYLPQIARQGKGGWYSLARSKAGTFPTHSDRR